jgi:hypothetical protein
MQLRSSDQDESEDEEPVRGTLAPVLRRSTERARYPVPAPVIRPPVKPNGPPEPSGAVQKLPTWEEALAADVTPGTRRERVSRPRHVSGGVGEYKPKTSPDISLTLLVSAMLLVLLAVVAVGIWAFWPRLLGR